jgi:hypothetical protein
MDSGVSAATESTVIAPPLAATVSSSSSSVAAANDTSSAGVGVGSTPTPTKTKKSKKSKTSSKIATEGDASKEDGKDDPDDIPLASAIVSETQRLDGLQKRSNRRPQVKNRQLKALLQCQSCSGGLDFPYCHQRCQHIVCGTCAFGLHESTLCKLCRSTLLDRHAQHFAQLTTTPHSNRMSDVVAAIAGRDWLNWSRADLDETNKPAFLQATASRNQIVSVNDPTYQALLNSADSSNQKAKANTGSSAAGKSSSRRRHPDADDYDDDYRPQNSRRCCGNGICGCLCGCFGDILCCCGAVTCVGDICYRARYWIRNFVIFIIIFAALSWIITGINYKITGQPDLRNWIYDPKAADAVPPYDAPLHTTNINATLNVVLEPKRDL